MRGSQTPLEIGCSTSIICQWLDYVSLELQVHRTAFFFFFSFFHCLRVFSFFLSFISPSSEQLFIKIVSSGSYVSCTLKVYFLGIQNSYVTDSIEVSTLGNKRLQLLFPMPPKVIKTEVFTYSQIGKCL